MSSLIIGGVKGILLIREYIKMFQHFLRFVSDWINLEQGVSLKMYWVVVFHENWHSESHTLLKGIDFTYRFSRFIVWFGWNWVLGRAYNTVEHLYHDSAGKTQVLLRISMKMTGTHADILLSVFCITSAALPSSFLTWPRCDDFS
jgi:hypothetical protein